jgi:hypothetical protein
MNRQTIYIASSWRNRHAVELLTDVLRARGHCVMSFVEAATPKEGAASKAGDVDSWINSEDGEQKFRFDTTSAMTCDVLVYIGPGGTDAWAEIGAAWARGVPVLGLRAKGEQAGLMRRMVNFWFDSWTDMLRYMEEKLG